MTPPDRLRLAYGYESWTTAVHLEAALRRSIAVDVSGPGHPPQPSTAGDAADPPLLWVESGVPWLPSPPTLASTKSAAWIIDTHRGLSWRTQLAGAFDCVFVAQADAVDPMREVGVPAAWLPLAVPRELCGAGPPLNERDYDIAFVGQAPRGSDRARILEELHTRFRVAPTVGYTPPDEMMDQYRRARVVINLPVARDLNMRTFESAGARALLVTGPATKLDQTLPPGSYVEVRGTEPREWANAVQAALLDPAAQRRADEAFDRVLASHTYDHRAHQLLETLDQTPRRVIEDDARDSRTRGSVVSLGSNRCSVGVGALPRRTHASRHERDRVVGGNVCECATSKVAEPANSGVTALARRR